MGSHSRTLAPSHALTPALSHSRSAHRQVAPSLEVKLGLGGTSYADFIGELNLPPQMADVDPIVASFCGGAVGVLTCLLIVEKNNSRLQAKQKCIYCKGTGTWVFCMFIGGRWLS